MDAIPVRIVKKYLALLEKVSERLSFEPGQVILYKGHKPYGMYFVRKGHVTLADDHKKDRAIGPGAFFGEDMLKHDKPCELTVRAEDDVQIVFIPKSILDFGQNRRKKGRVSI